VEGTEKERVQKVEVPLGGTANGMLCREYTALLSFVSCGEADIRIGGDQLSCSSRLLYVFFFLCQPECAQSHESTLEEGKFISNVLLAYTNSQPDTIYSVTIYAVALKDALKIHRAPHPSPLPEGEGAKWTRFLPLPWMGEAGPRFNYVVTAWG
jgi:hypothetical protein